MLEQLCLIMRRISEHEQRLIYFDLHQPNREITNCEAREKGQVIVIFNLFLHLVLVIRLPATDQALPLQINCII